MVYFGREPLMCYPVTLTTLLSLNKVTQTLTRLSNQISKYPQQNVQKGSHTQSKMVRADPAAIFHVHKIMVSVET